MVPFLAIEVSRTLDRQIIRFGCAAGPDDFARVGIDQVGDVLACLVDGFLRGPAKFVAARCGITKIVFDGQKMGHLVGDALVDRRGRTVIEVYR